MSLVLTWATRNKELQADVPVDHFAASVAPPVGLQTVCKWYWRADPGDDWSVPSIRIIDLPTTSDSYDPPGAGWVRLESYTQLNGLGCWEPYEWEGEVDGAGEPVNPARYVDQDGNPYVDENADTYFDA